MQYYELGDLAHYITKDFYNISWSEKLDRLKYIIKGLKFMHEGGVIHQDLHSGNIFIINTKYYKALIGDLGISKSATESSNDDNEIYGIIPYVAPEIFQGQKYTQASDVYSFGMVMWEIMTGRRPFWNRNHDTELIIEICDGLRPPICDLNAPDGYIGLMKKCWNPDPIKRPKACNIFDKVYKMMNNEKNNPTDIIKSQNIGPITMNNPGAIYKSKPLSDMIKYAMYTRSLRSQPISSEFGNQFNL